MPSSRTGFLAIGLVAGLIVSGTVAAVAAAPKTTSVQITACYAKSGGAARLIDLNKGQKCTRNENRIAWNQRGPTGQRGPAGPRGIQGDTGVVEILFGSESDEERPIGIYSPNNLANTVTRFATTQSFVAGENQEAVVTGTVSAVAPEALSIIGFPMFSEDNGSTWSNCGGGGYQSVPAPTSIGAAFSFTGHCALALTPGATYRFAMGVAIFQVGMGSSLTTFTDTVYQFADLTATVVQSD